MNIQDARCKKDELMKKLVVILSLALILISSICACEQREGPAERVGKKIDKAAQELKEGVEEFADDIEESTDKIEED